MSSAPDRHSWRDAAVAASFPAHQPVDPLPDAVWLGGFGSSRYGTSHLGISALLDGGEIDVDTMTPRRRGDGLDLEQRGRIAEAVWHHLMSGAGSVTLPLDVRIDADDRVIVVDGRERTFTGVRVAGSSRWSGACVVGELLIRVTFVEPAVVRAISATDGSGIDDLPPGANE